MSDSLLDQLKARGEAFFTEISNNLMANPTFIEVMKKGMAAKETLDKQVADALPRMNVATRRDVSKLEERIAELETELRGMKSKPAATSASTNRSAPSRTAPSRPAAKPAASKKSSPARKAPARRK